MKSEKRKELSPERVVEILSKKGTHVDIEEAEIILDFVEKVVQVAVSQYIRGCF